MKNNNYKERLLTFCNNFSNLVGWDFEKDQLEWDSKKTRFIRADENLKKATLKAKTEANDYYGRGIVSLYDRIFSKTYDPGFSSYLGVAKLADFQLHEIENQKNIALEIHSLINLYNDWYNTEYQSVLDKFIKDDLFTNKELNVHPSILERINTLVNKGLFQLYEYKKGSSKLLDSDEFYISSEIGFSENLTLYFKHLEKQQDFLDAQEDNKIFVTLFGKLDKIHPIYSNWILTFHKGDSVWLASDAQEFNNPYQKHHRLSRKSVWDKRDELTENCDLPYHLFEDLEKLRADVTSIATQNNFKFHKTTVKQTPKDSDLYGSFGSITNPRILIEILKKELLNLNIDYDVIYPIGERDHFDVTYKTCEIKKNGEIVAIWTYQTDQIVEYLTPEIIIKPLSSIKDEEKVFLLFLIEELINFFSLDNIKLKKVMLAENFINLKLIEGATVDPIETTRMEYWNDVSKEIFNGIIDTLNKIDNTVEIQNSTAISLKTYDLVKYTNEYDRNWLTTSENLESLSEWLLLEKEFNTLYPRLSKLRNLAGEAEKWLYKKCNGNFDNILKKFSSARKIELMRENYSHASFTTERKLYNSGFIRNQINESKGNKGFGVGKDFFDSISSWHEQTCKCCKKSNSKQVARIRITHFEELMWLLDITDRNELHPYYQNYRSHFNTPYTGNSLLQQTHPYLRLKDPCSNTKPNGIELDLFVCGHCWKKLAKNQKETEEIILNKFI